MNVFTVDVEEWFHVCGSTFAYRPSLAPFRACGPHDHAGPRSAGPRRRHRDIFRGGVGCRALSGADCADRRCGPDVGSHSQMHRRIYELTPINSLPICQRQCEHRRHRRPSSDGVPRAGMVHQRSGDLGARRTGAPGLRSGCQHGATQDRWPRRLSPRSAHTATSAGPIVELPPLVADRFGQVMPIGWGWGLRMSSATRCCGRSLTRMPPAQRS